MELVQETVSLGLIFNVVSAWLSTICCVKGGFFFSSLKSYTCLPIKFQQTFGSERNCQGLARR